MLSAVVKKVLFLISALVLLVGVVLRLKPWTRGKHEKSSTPKIGLLILNILGGGGGDNEPMLF